MEHNPSDRTSRPGSSVPPAESRAVRTLPSIGGPSTVLQLNKRTEYALIALVHMVDQDAIGADPERFVSAREIGDRYPLPRRLLAEVLKDLQRAGVVHSQRGASGGYAIARRAEDLPLGDIVMAMEGPPGLTGCESFSGEATPCELETNCPIKSPMSRVRQGIWILFQATTLRDLATPGALAELATTQANGMHAVPPTTEPRSTAAHRGRD